MLQPMTRPNQYPHDHAVMPACNTMNIISDFADADPEFDMHQASVLYQGDQIRCQASSPLEGTVHLQMTIFAISGPCTIQMPCNRPGSLILSGFKVEVWYAGSHSDASDMSGAFNRPESRHRHWIRADGSTDFKPESSRYHLFVSNNCPWCHR